MGLYLPYITSSRKEKTKIDAIVSNGLKIDGLVIDIRRLFGNMFSRTVDIVKKVWSSNPNAIVIIDPRTDAFQVDTSTREKISSLQKIYSLAGLTEQDIKDDSKFTASAIENMLDKLISNIYSLIKKISYKDLNDALHELSYFIPPYFVSNSYNDEWYALTKTAIQRSIDMIKDMKILAPIAISETFLKNENNIKQLINDYKEFDVDGYIILPFDVNDTAASRTVLENLARLALALKKLGKFVIVAIAEFGNVLVSLGIDALTFGICSHKAPYPPRVFEKGIAEIARTETQLYIPSIFRKLHAEKVIKLLELIPSAYQCSCPICSHYEGSYMDLLEEAGYTDFSVHYMFWKKQEIKRYSNNPDLLLKDLENAGQLIQQYNEQVGEEYFYIEEARYRYAIDKSYIDKWSNILSTLSQSDSASEK